MRFKWFCSSFQIIITIGFTALSRFTRVGRLYHILTFSISHDPVYLHALTSRASSHLIPIPWYPLLVKRDFITGETWFHHWWNIIPLLVKCDSVRKVIPLLVKRDFVTGETRFRYWWNVIPLLVNVIPLLMNHDSVTGNCDSVTSETWFRY